MLGENGQPRLLPSKPFPLRSYLPIFLSSAPLSRCPPEFPTIRMFSAGPPDPEHREKIRLRPRTVLVRNG
jgi:hypothetical protein